MFFAACIAASAQPVVLVNESFSSTQNLLDLSLLHSWGTYSSPTSAFQVGQKTDGASLSYQAISSTDSAKAYVGYTRPGQLKAASAFDIRFPKIDRTNDTVSLEFDIIWNGRTQGGNEGRVVVAFLHDIPTRPLQFGDLDSVQLTAPHGRPAYSFRVLARNPSGVNNYANMMYGGGRDTLGEFEKYANAQAMPPVAYWLPGFISGPGGVTPEGSGLGYPINGQAVRRWQFTTLASSTAWQHFRWVLYPEKLELYHRATADLPANEVLVMYMALPKPAPVADMLNAINTMHSTTETQLPKLYNYFPELEGVRIYFNAGEITSMANLNVTATEGTPFVGGLKNRLTAIAAFPNPSRDEVVFPEFIQTENTEALITNSVGKSFKRIVESGKLSIDDLPKGIYNVSLRKNQYLYSAKIVKE